ncbi:hypothetical protein GG344DRAFT_69474 [Lentinula edodes]|nr:hypothetical protein GG344DRAFT_69474 [Lentinula edodes]
MFDYFDDQFRLQMDEAGYATGTNSVHVQTGCGSHQFLSRIDAEQNLSLTSSWNSSVSIVLGVIANLVAENTAKSLSSPVIGGMSGGGSLGQYCRGQWLIEVLPELIYTIVVGKFDFDHDYTQAGGSVANVTSNRIDSRTCSSGAVTGYSRTLEFDHEDAASDQNQHGKSDNSLVKSSA